MHPPPFLEDERERLNALRQLCLLNTLPEERFDRLTRLAQQMFHVPIALISLVDAERQWFKSCQGLAVSETSRDISFCGHAILGSEIFSITDARADPRFADNPLVIGPPFIRFYAGAPLRTLDGYRIGTLCIIDDKPRQLTMQEHAALRDLADCVQDEMNVRQQQRQYDALLTLTRITALVISDPHIALREALQLGCDYLHMPIGMISRVVGNDYEVQVQVSPLGILKEAQHFPLDQTYCSLTLHADDVVTIEHMQQSQYAGHPCYQAFRLESYIGIPIYLEGIPYGTLSFSSPAPRMGDHYTHADIEFLRVLEAWVTTTIQRWQLDKSLQDHQQLNEIIAQAQSQFICGTNRSEGFDTLLKGILALTQSEYGFIGERLHAATLDEPYVKTVFDSSWHDTHYVFSNISQSKEITLSNFKPFIDNVMESIVPVIMNHPEDSLCETSPSTRTSSRIHTFLGLPVIHGGEQVAVVGIANRAAGYDSHWVHFLQPLLGSIGQLVVAARNRRQLSESERRLRSMIDGTCVATWEWNRQTGETVFNERWAELVGYVPAQQEPIHTLARHFVNLIHTEDMAQVDQAVEAAVRHAHAWAVEYRLRHQDGSLRWVFEKGSAEYTEDGQIQSLSGFMHDITEQKAIRSQIERSQKELKNFFDLSLNFLCIANINGYFEKVNATFCRVLGYTEEELLQSGFLNFIHPDDVTVTLQEVEKLTRGVPSIYFVNRYVSKKGEYISLLWNCAPDTETGKLYATAVDITQQQLVERALREQAQQTQAILENIVDGIVTIDREGVMVSVNPAAERIFGYRREQMLNHNIKMLLPIAQKESPAIFLSGHRELEGLRSDNTLFPMEIVISELMREGKPIYVGTIRDITERKREEQLKSEFVSVVSHELRTPLTSISGALDLVAGGILGELPPQALEMIKIAHKNSQRLTYLINDLLDMEKLVAGKMSFDMQSQRLMPLIEQALTANQEYGRGRRVLLCLTHSDADAEVMVDAQRLMQVLSNLLSNAIKYSHEGGRVEIAVVSLAKSVQVRITDHGSGIPVKFRDRLFQKFAQADSSDTRQKGGTGLGLAITRELVERMGGQIGFESEEGKGACFFFDLPLWNKDEPSALVHPATKDTRILVIEGETDVAHQLGMILTRAGYQVDTVTTGGKALQEFQRSSYDAVIVDVMLSDMSALDVIVQLRQDSETLYLPIIVVSADLVAPGELAIDSSFLGVDWLAKPVDETQLLTLLKQQLPLSGGERFRVLHVEDDADLHRVVSAILGKRFKFELATTLADAVTRIKHEHFDIVILDLVLPDGSGWDLLSLLWSQQSTTRVVILTSTDISPRDASKVEAVLLKSRMSSQELIGAIRDCIRLTRSKGPLS